MSSKISLLYSRYESLPPTSAVEVIKREGFVCVCVCVSVCGRTDWRTVTTFGTGIDLDDISRKFNGQGHRSKVIQLKNIILEFWPRLVQSAYKGFMCIHAINFVHAHARNHIMIYAHKHKLIGHAGGAATLKCFFFKVCSLWSLSIQHMNDLPSSMFAHLLGNLTLNQWEKIGRGIELDNILDMFDDQRSRSPKKKQVISMVFWFKCPDTRH